LSSVADIDQTAFNKALTTNVLATQALIAQFDPMLRKSPDARVIGLSSSVATAPRAYWGAYAASKAAFEVLLDCYAQETRNISKVRVAIVNPGATRTAMRARAYPGEDPASVKPPQAVAERLIGLLGEQFASPHRESVNQAG
jgi:NAD(P)-dependent dehydrogenase (short-subunit alcohol dehydrogenase family)